MQTAALILNPVAGPRRGRLAPAAAAALLRAAGVEPEILITAGAHEATALAVRAAQRHPWVAVAGGDGTVSEVVRGLAGTPAVLVVLPTGSGNDFAHGLGIADAAAGAGAIRDGRTAEVDVAEFAGRVFVNSCGLLLDGEVALSAAAVDRRWGRLRYPLATLGPLWRSRPAAVRWDLRGADGTTTLEGDWMLAEIGNGPRCGGGFLLTPGADPCDGQLDLCLVPAMPRRDLVRLLPRGLRGTHVADPRIVMRRIVGATVDFDAPAAVHWDGEAGRLPAGRHELRLLPRGVQVRLPHGPRPRRGGLLR
ncbi:MAG: diacylglycerol kinase family protein [Candidatus Latescibacteria bacterium]|nr:diacylglycerol kinase family protein [Candidatus Latescibacterota bacterium]